MPQMINFRQKLDQWAHRNPEWPITLSFTSSGPEHSRTYACTCTLNGTVTFVGDEKNNMRDAQESAAKKAFQAVSDFRGRGWEGSGGSGATPKERYQSKFLRIASLDDGGARSVSQLEIMRCIMHQVRKVKYPDDPGRFMLPCEHFELIGGAGTGGLIAIMFVKLRMSIEEVITEFGTIVDKVYTSKLEPAKKTKKLRKCLESLLIRRNLPIDLRLKEKKEQPGRCLGFVIAENVNAGSTAKSGDNAHDGRHSHPISFRTYANQGKSSQRITVVEAAIATCALQPEFLPLALGANPEPRDPGYVRPALDTSDPTHQVMAKAQKHFGERFKEDPRIILLLSLGSGTPGAVPLNPHRGSNTSDTQRPEEARDKKAHKIHEHSDQDGVYFRFSMEEETRQSDLGPMPTQMDRYLRNPETAKQIDDCAGNIMNTVDTAEKLALARHTKGRYDEAEKLQREVIRERQQVLGTEHPDTIIAMENMVVILTEQLRWAEAERLQLEVLGKQRNSLGSQHPRAIKAAVVLVAIRSEQEDWRETQRLQRNILDQKTRTLGEDHLDTIRAAANLASTYHVQGVWGAATNLRLGILKQRTGILGEDHPDTILAADNLEATHSAPKEVAATGCFLQSLKNSNRAGEVDSFGRVGL